MLALLGTSFTFLMTALGAATVVFIARSVCERAQGALLGFAAGVMTAARVWSPLLFVFLFLVFVFLFVFLLFLFVFWALVVGLCVLF